MFIKMVNMKQHPLFLALFFVPENEASLGMKLVKKSIVYATVANKTESQIVKVT